MFPVNKGPPQHHPPGQPLYPLVVDVQALPPLPGPPPITEVCLEHNDAVESLSHLCNRENSLSAAPSRLGDELEAPLRQDETHYWQASGLQGCLKNVRIKGVFLFFFFGRAMQHVGS